MLGRTCLTTRAALQPQEPATVNTSEPQQILKSAEEMELAYLRSLALFARVAASSGAGLR